MQNRTNFKLARLNHGLIIGYGPLHSNVLGAGIMVHYLIQSPSMTWNIGKLTLTKKAIQSPMVGVSDWVYRQMIREYGAELTYAEMASSEAFTRDAKKSHDIVKTTPEDTPTGAQIMGAKPEVMAEASKRLADMGFSLIDINVGCPAKKVVKQGAGSALLKDEKLFASIISSIVKTVSLPVTVKLRIGYEAHDEAHFVRLLKIAEAEGIAAIAIHGRTQKQGYKGHADLAPIKLANTTVKCPVIGNGDVTNAEKAMQMFQETGCDAVMIGRGSLGNPWIFNEINAALDGQAPPPRPTFEDELELLIRHMKGMAKWHGEKLGMLKMRKLVGYYFSDSTPVARFRKKAVLTSTVDEFMEAVDFLRELLEEKCHPTA